MLLSMKHLAGYRLRATDGELGEVVSFYFDDQAWTIRYLVVRTGRWFGREVLLSPQVIGKPDAANRAILVNLTQENIKAAPDVDLEKPVSKQQEAQLAKYYGWSMSWPLAAPVPPPIPPPPEAPAIVEPHLRSSAEILGYSIHAKDGSIGRAVDFIYDDEEWIVRYLVVNTGQWLSGREVLVFPSAIQRIEWSDRKIDVDMTRTAIQDSPAFDPKTPVNREYEEVLVDYYGRPRYWRPSRS